MTVDWSSEVMKWEYRDLQATAMTVDYSGNNVLLAGRRWLAIKQLTPTFDDEGVEVLKKYQRHSKYDATDAEWCQTHAGQRLCAISSNQRVDVYHWGNGDLTCTNSLRGHTRVVSDTHFHRQDHNLIATCSIDTFTHIWDLRDARKPVLSLCAVAGASQVQWNKVNSHILATAHDGDIKIWDKRRGSSPIHYISAHLCKIHGVDWSPHHEYQLVTSSHDGSIKYFDVNNARRPENTITTNFPVWRAIYTPFGNGLLTVGVGWGGLPRGEQAGVVGVWVGGALTHRLVGHTDTMVTMRWRPNTNPANFQLVTWARDQTLRIWSMHPTLLKMCQHYLPQETEGEDDCVSEATSYSSVTSSTNDLSLSEQSGQEIQMVKLCPQKPTHSLDEEFESVRGMASVLVTDISVDERTCVVRIERNDYVAALQVTFPQPLTEHAIPRFAWMCGTTVDSQTTIKILQAINLTAHLKLKSGQPCLLHCLGTLATMIDQIPVKPREDLDGGKSRCASEGESAGDACIPFPRTCGATWCGVHTLVVFNRPPNARRLSLKQDCGTPRSMASLSLIPAVLPVGGSASPLATTTPSPTNTPGFPHFHRHLSNSITTFYFQDRWKAQGRRPLSRSRGCAPGQAMPRVVLYSASHLFPLSKTIAEKYTINNHSPVDMCLHNASVADESADAGVARAWQLAALAARGLRDGASAAALTGSSEESAGWAEHPLCATLVQSLIVHYAKSADVQTAAMLACSFAPFCDSRAPSTLSSTSGSTYQGDGTSPYSTVQAADGRTSLRDAGSDAADSARASPCRADPPCVDDATLHLYHCFKRAYADVLHRWQLLTKRAEVMKQVRSCERSVARHSGPELASECGHCRSLVCDAACNKCGRLALSCSVCGVGVRGLASACALCGHGGHALHVSRWFSSHDVCPTGCGCKCAATGASPAWSAAKFL